MSGPHAEKVAERPPFFSVIIPAYNRAGVIGATLASVAQQDEKDYEILVVDDGSTDDTAQVAAALSGVRVLRQENGGPGKARNLGISKARGRYVAFLDSDDVWFPWTLRTYREAIEAHGEPAFVAGKHVAFEDDDALRRVGSSPMRARRFSDYLETAAAEVWIGTCGACIRRDALESVDGFTPRHINAEDSDLWLRLGTAPGLIRIEDPPVFGYRMQQGSAVADLRRTYEGSRHLIGQERAGQYPGGLARRRERWEIITRHVRPASIRCLRGGLLLQGCALYAATLPWNAALMRVRYLGAFPLLAALKVVGKLSAERERRPTAA